MSEPNEQAQASGAPSHVGDCYIWVEIYYLDSATDYRECLVPKPRNPQSDFGELVMLDEKRHRLHCGLCFEMSRGERFSSCTRLITSPGCACGSRIEILDTSKPTVHTRALLFSRQTFLSSPGKITLTIVNSKLFGTLDNESME